MPVASLYRSTQWDRWATVDWPGCSERWVVDRVRPLLLLADDRRSSRRTYVTRGGAIVARRTYLCMLSTSPQFLFLLVTYTAVMTRRRATFHLVWSWRSLGRLRIKSIDQSTLIKLRSDCWSADAE